MPQQVNTTLRMRRRKDSGTILLDYALGAVIVALGALAATQVMGWKVNSAFNNLTRSVAQAF